MVRSLQRTQQQESRGQTQQGRQQRHHLAQDQRKQYLRTEVHHQQDQNHQNLLVQQQEGQEDWQRHGLQQHDQQRQQLQEPQPCFAAPRVHVKFLGGKRERGLVASEPIEASEVIYTEESPLLAVQHEFSRLCGLTCSNCLRFVGSLKDCIRHVLIQGGRHELVADLSLLPDSFIQKTGLSLGPVVPCGETGCPAVYCSQECYEHARRDTIHRMVCVEAADRKAWLKFLSHARRHHDGLVMAGACVAQVVFEVLFKGRQFPEALRRFRQFYSAPWESLAPDSSVSGGPAGSLGGPRTDTAEGRRSLLLESLELLKRVLDPIISCSGDPELRDTLGSLFQLDLYSRLLGTFSLVCLDVEFPHPLNRRLVDLQRTLFLLRYRREEIPEGLCGVPLEVLAPSGVCQRPSLRLQDVSAEDEQHAFLLRKFLKEVHAITRWDDDDAGPEEPGSPEASADPSVYTWGAPLLPFIGWGLFRLGSMTNHSCWPNAEADFPLHSTALEVRALRPIDMEEEVTVSYIDEALPLHQRRQILQKHYGFTCTCPRCVVEAAEALLVVMRAPECSDGAKLEELVARRTGLPLAVVTEVRQYSRRLHKP
ncbi:hypothetical protein, conserved [Eimeria brunetti]|uniref:SET domain-containing protein n=1 Tax=Eimeria brunetti TaxID=51314 RepID=U6LH58_9EIME|nr:hypothetical protein, conserved [Eimeria brunetti]